MRVLEDAATEWVLDIAVDPRTKQPMSALLLGDALYSLNEHVLVEAPTEALAFDGGNGRVYSHPEHGGWNVKVRLRRRGDVEARTATLVIPAAVMPQLLEFFSDW